MLTLSLNKIRQGRAHKMRLLIFEKNYGRRSFDNNFTDIKNGERIYILIMMIDE